MRKRLSLVRNPLLAIAVGLAIVGRPCDAVESPVDGMIEAVIGGRDVEGLPLQWDEQEVHLLGRDGRLWAFDPRRVARFRKTADQFRPYSLSELRAALLRELGGEYEVSGTGHFLIAHPRGERDRWPERFEDLYRSFVRYFSVRGFPLDAPRFPLVGLVCRNRVEFMQRAAAQGGAGAGVVGYYDPTSNWITIYDMGAEGGKADWRRNASALIHEATHQTAFNTGVHSRYSEPPLWVAEGLATLFEAPGVYDSHAYPQRADRINRERLAAFRRGVAPRHRPELLASIVASDELFHVNPAAAYAEAWALTFFLVETDPSRYVRYLKRTASHPPFQKITAAERTADFTAIFGTDWRMLESRFLRFMAGVGN